MLALNLPLRERFKRVLLPEMLEPLYAQGLSRAEVAKKLGLNYQYLSRRIRESLSLSQAERRGQLACAAQELEKTNHL